MFAPYLTFDLWFGKYPNYLQDLHDCEYAYMYACIGWDSKVTLRKKEAQKIQLVPRTERAYLVDKMLSLDCYFWQFRCFKSFCFELWSICELLPPQGGNANWGKKRLGAKFGERFLYENEFPGSGKRNEVIIVGRSLEICLGQRQKFRSLRFENGLPHWQKSVRKILK